MRNYKVNKKIISCLLIVGFFHISTSAIDIYLGNLGSFDSKTENIKQIQDISTRLQLDLLKLSNAKVNYKLLYAVADDTPADYLDTVVDTKLNALGVSIFYNVNYVLFGNIFIEPKTNLYTCFIKIYDKDLNNIFYETNHSRVIADGNHSAFASELAELINNQLYIKITGRNFEKPQPGEVPDSSAEEKPEDSTETEEFPEVPLTDSPQASPSPIPMDDEVKAYLEQILHILNEEKGNFSEAPSPRADQSPTPAPTPSPTPSGTVPAEPTPALGPVLDIDLSNLQPGRGANLAGPSEKRLSIINAGGYPFLVAGKWKGPLTMVLAIESGLKYRFSLFNFDDFRLYLRPHLAFNYSFGNRAKISKNYFIRYHSFTPKIGLDGYLTMADRYGVYLGGGAAFKYTSIDFRELSYHYCTDVEYAPGFYAELGGEILLGNDRGLGLGLNNILNYIFFQSDLVDYTVALTLTYHL